MPKNVGVKVFASSPLTTGPNRGILSVASVRRIGRGECLNMSKQAAQGKVDEAAFFLRKLWEVDGQRLEEDELQFGHYLSAFLTAARSAIMILNDQKWVNRETKGWSPDEQELYRVMTKTRNLSVHEGKGKAKGTIEFVPEWELPRRSRHAREGYAYITPLPGIPPTRIGVMSFTLRIENQSLSAVKCGREYLELVKRLVASYPVTHLTP
jgi:hypothetical protein